MPDKTLVRILNDVIDGAGSVLDANQAGYGTILQGTKTVTTAGTAVALTTGTACSGVLVSALHTNTGFMYVGNASVTSATYGRRLRAEEAVSLAVTNLNLVYINSSVDGEGVSYLGVV